MVFVHVFDTIDDKHDMNLASPPPVGKICGKQFLPVLSILVDYFRNVCYNKKIRGKIADSSCYVAKNLTEHREQKNEKVHKQNCICIIDSGVSCNMYRHCSD